MELLVVVAIVGILAALLLPAMSSALRRAERTEFVGQMRSVGAAMNLYAFDHGGRFVGPLWPGQVAEFDAARDGRLVRDLAPYLGIEAKPAPYVVPQFLPDAFRKALPGVAPKDIRVFVMNMSVPAETGTFNAWGSLAAQPASTPQLRAALPSTANRVWAMSEAYQTHPRVVTAAWRASTVPKPVYGSRPLALFFDGSVAEVDPAELR